MTPSVGVTVAYFEPARQQTVVFAYLQTRKAAAKVKIMNRDCVATLTPKELNPLQRGAPLSIRVGFSEAEEEAL